MSAVVPVSPGAGVGTLGPQIGSFFNNLWSAMSSAGLAAGAGTASAFSIALGELGLVLSLGGDSNQSQRGASAAQQKVAAELVALGGAANRAFAFTHNPGGSLRKIAGSGILYAETAEPDPESIDDVKAILDRDTRSGKTRPHRQVETPEELEDVFEKTSRGGESIDSPASYDGVRVKLPDGTIIGYRNKSASGGATVDIKPPAAPPIKIHLPKGFGK